MRRLPETRSARNGVLDRQICWPGLSRRSSCKSHHLRALKTAQLPDGRSVACVSKDEVAFLYKEIFTDTCYLRHGLSLQPGDTVVDIGANIGLFSMLAAEAVGSHGRVIAVEPMPLVFQALKANIDSMAQAAEAQPSPGVGFARIVPLGMGITDGKKASAEFTFYPRATGWSTMNPDEQEVEVAMEAFLVHALKTGDGIPDSLLAKLGRLLSAVLPMPALQVVSRLYTKWLLSKKTTVVLSSTTISEIIKEQELTRIDLLKIDVERAELLAIDGIWLGDWEKIKQIVVEVHGDASMATLLQRFESEDFEHIVCKQSPMLKGTTLHTIFATRSDS